jgi:hypothetical protein
LFDTWKRSSQRRSKRSTERRNSPPRNISPTRLDIAWIKEKQQQEQQKKWENSTTTMKERKPRHIMNRNTKTMARREQVVIRLRTGYTRTTHSAVMDKEPSPEYPFCAVNLTTDYILWHCKETETKQLQMDITEEIWKGGKQEMNKLIKYVKEI